MLLLYIDTRDEISFHEAAATLTEMVKHLLPEFCPHGFRMSYDA